MVTLDSFYRSKDWQAFRLVLINERLNEQGEIICERCGEPITHKYDCILHHVTELTEANVNDVNISLNPDNIKLLHHVCHNREHEKFGYKTKQIYLVYGAPLSGKSSYVKEVMTEGDLIVDMDSIWQCVSGCRRYIKPPRLNANVFGVRDLLIEQIKHRVGRWNNCYLIGGYPLVGERERLMKSLGAREIFIDTSYEECIERLKATQDGRNFNEWERFIDDWFRKAGRTPPTIG